MTIAIKRRFIEIANGLSPENLYCDGERSVSEARRIVAVLKKEWSKLEAEIGHPVNEQMIYEHFLPEVHRADEAERSAKMASDVQNAKVTHAHPGHWRRMATNGEIAYNIYETANKRYVVSFAFSALNGPTNPNGDYASLEEAIECADAVLRGITAETIRRRFPLWQDFAIEREVARAKVS